MNGKQLLESMSYVDERYIEEADRKPTGHRLRWQHLAALAACMGLVVLAAGIPSRVRKQTAATTGVTSQETSELRAVPEQDGTAAETWKAFAQKETSAASNALPDSGPNDMAAPIAPINGAFNDLPMPAAGIGSVSQGEIRPDRSMETALDVETDGALAKAMEMVVRVVSKEENILVCTVVQSETDAFPVDATVKLDLTVIQQETLSFRENQLLQLLCLPQQGTELRAEQILPVEEVRGD